MRLKINDILKSVGPLQKLGNASGLSSIVAFKILENINAINPKLKNYEIARDKIVLEHVEKNERGEPVVLDNGSFKLVKEDAMTVDDEIENLVQSEIELDIRKISLEDIDKAGLTPFELDNIRFMLEVK